MGDYFVEPWVTSNFHVPLGGTQPDGGFKIFHTFFFFFFFFFVGGVNRVSSTGRMGGFLPPLAKHLLIPPPLGKVPLPAVNLLSPTVKFLFPPLKVHYLTLPNKNVTAVLAPVPLLFYLPILCTHRSCYF